MLEKSSKQIDHVDVMNKLTELTIIEHDQKKQSKKKYFF